jgi:hypothetical protein
MGGKIITSRSVVSVAGRAMTRVRRVMKTVLGCQKIDLAESEGR